jgi:hypothetical protein
VRAVWLPIFQSGPLHYIIRSVDDPVMQA